MQVHGNDVGNRADEILLHAVKHKYCEIGAQTQNYLQKQEAGQRNLTKERRKEHQHQTQCVWEQKTAERVQGLLILNKASLCKSSDNVSSINSKSVQVTSSRHCSLHFKYAFFSILCIFIYKLFFFLNKSCLLPY